jgi:uncharacterized integral membrane protein
MYSQNIVPWLIIISAFLSTLVLYNNLESYALLPFIIMILTACYVFQNKTPGFRATKGRYAILQWIVFLSFVLLLVYTHLFCEIIKSLVESKISLVVLCTISVIAVVGLCLLEKILDLFVYPALPSTGGTSEEAVESTNHKSKIIWFVVEMLLVLFIIMYIIYNHQASTIVNKRQQASPTVTNRHQPSPTVTNRHQASPLARNLRTNQGLRRTGRPSNKMDRGSPTIYEHVLTDQLLKKARNLRTSQGLRRTGPPSTKMG